MKGREGAAPQVKSQKEKVKSSVSLRDLNWVIESVR